MLPRALSRLFGALTRAELSASFSLISTTSPETGEYTSEAAWTRRGRKNCESGQSMFNGCRTTTGGFGKNNSFERGSCNSPRLDQRGSIT